MKETVHKRVYSVVSDVLGVPASELTPGSSPDELRQWDSVSHLTLVVALESEFGVAFTDEDVMEMLSISLIETILADRGAGRE